MSSSSPSAPHDDRPMTNTSPGPRAGRPKSRRTFTPAQKLDLLAGYEDAILRNEGGAYLRQEGIYSFQITEWRKLRDAGVLAGRNPGEKIGLLFNLLT
jgi:transposase